MALTIAFVIETSGGGSGRHLLDLAAGLVERGHGVHVLYSEIRAEPRFTSSLKSIAGLTVASVPMRREPHPSDLAASIMIARYLARHGPFDIVHGQSSKGGALARLAAGARDTARIYTPHCFRTLDPGLGGFGRLLYGSAEWILAFRSDAIICVSPDEHAHALAQGLPRDKLHVVLNGTKPIDVSRRESLRAQLGIGADDVAIGFLGRYVPQKAPERMIDLAASLVSDMPLWRIVMIGEGPLEPMLRARAEAIGAASRIAWGSGDIGPAAMAAFDLFAMPSAYEGMPYVLIEAVAAGLPIVASDVGGVRAVITQGENGAVIRNWDGAEFATQISRLVRDEGLRRRMSAASRARAGAFSVGTMVDQTLVVYERALAGRRSRAVMQRARADAAAAGKNGS